MAGVGWAILPNWLCNPSTRTNTSKHTNTRKSHPLHPAGSEVQTLNPNPTIHTRMRMQVAEKRVAQVGREADSLARDVAGLQEKLGRGEFSRSSNTRVLHLRMNPEVEAHRAAKEGEVGALRAENAALKTALEAAEARAAAAETAAAAAGTAAVAGGGEGAGGGANTGGDGGEAGAVAGGTASGTAAVAQHARSVGLLEAEVAVARHKVAEADKAAARLREVCGFFPFFLRSFQLLGAKRRFWWPWPHGPRG